MATSIAASIAWHETLKTSKMQMAYPKMLTWQARRAAISIDVAKELWLAAVYDATAECGVVASPEYWQSAVDHFLRRVAKHSRRVRY